MRTGRYECFAQALDIAAGGNVMRRGDFRWNNRLYERKQRGQLSVEDERKAIDTLIKRAGFDPHSPENRAFSTLRLVLPSTSRTILTSIGEGKAVLASTRILRHINAIVTSEEPPLYHVAGMDITGRPLDTHMNAMQLMLLYRLIEIIPRLSPNPGTRRQSTQGVFR